jgi:hypothetical protein
MARIQWDQDRFYESGLDHGVLYLENSIGVAWNGFKENEISFNGFSSAESFFDGNKFIDYPINGDISFTLKAFTYPEEFEEYAGYDILETGLSSTNQVRKSFGLTYRTLIGTSDDGIDFGYKIHILYNLTVSPDKRSYQTVDSNVDPVDFVWNATTYPVVLDGHLPTAYAVVDSRYLESTVLEHLEEILYGTDSRDPMLPSLASLLEMLNSELIIVITDHGDGSWSAEGPAEAIIMLDSTTFQITSPSAVYLDADTYTISSS